MKTNIRLRAFFSAATNCMFALIWLSVTATMTSAQTNTFPSSGNAGVGTTSPATALEVRGSGVTSRVTTTGTTGAHGKFQILAADIANNPFGEMQLYAPTGAGSEYLRFNFSNSSGTVFPDVLTINRLGNVGISTTGPLGRFQVVTPSYTDTSIPAWDSHFFVVGADGNSGGISLSYNQSTNTGYLMSLSPNVAWRNTVIQPFAGNVGIGTTSPNFNLDVNRGAAAADVILGIDSNGSNTYSPMLYFRNTGTAISKIMTAQDLQFQNTNNTPLLYLKTNGNFGIGTTSPSTKLHVVGDVTVTGNIAAKYQDVAEWVPSAQQLSAGTVVVLDVSKSNQVVASTVRYDTRVAGVISEQPGIALGESGAGKILVAISGRVRAKVDASRGPIQIGDLLVTSDIPGMAMKSEPVKVSGVQLHRPGTLIGKALEPLARGQGEILVLLSLQ